MVGKTIKKWWPIFVLPTLAAFIIGFLWPFIWGIYLSFCKFTTVQDVTFVGFSNYQKILLDNTFSQVRKSAEEVNKMLNKMSKKDEKKEK